MESRKGRSMRLINADELKETFIEAGQNSGGEWGKNWKLTWKQILDVIDQAPTVDAVAVVRCKDCKHRTELCGVGWLPCTDMAVNNNWYCADGERKD